MANKFRKNESWTNGCHFLRSYSICLKAITCVLSFALLCMWINWFRRILLVTFLGNISCLKAITCVLSLALLCMCINWFRMILLVIVTFLGNISQQIPEWASMSSGNSRIPNCLPNVAFMEILYKWFVLHNIRNTTLHWTSGTSWRCSSTGGKMRGTLLSITGLHYSQTSLISISITLSNGWYATQNSKACRHTKLVHKVQ